MILEARSTVCEESDTLRSINYLRESWLAVWGNIAMRAGVIKLNAFFRSSPRILRPPYLSELPTDRSPLFFHKSLNDACAESFSQNC